MLSQVPTLSVADNIQFTYQAKMQKLDWAKIEKRGEIRAHH
jgi:hypothetical protein